MGWGTMAGTLVLVLDWELKLGTGTAVLAIGWDLELGTGTAVLAIGWSGGVPGIHWACLGNSAWVRVLVGVGGTTGLAMGKVIWLKLSKEILLVGCMA